MKNIHLLPTDKPSRIIYNDANQLCYQSNKSFKNDRKNRKKFNIYITNDEEIKDVRPHNGKWQLEKGQILNKFPDYLTDLSECKLVIMTTDQDLIKDGVQAIDDEFLEWFVKNPSCEFVDVVKEMYMPQSNGKISDGKITHELSLNESLNTLPFYRIIITQEEPKQETLEEAAKRTYQKGLQDDIDLSFYDGVRLGAEWKAERMYSEVFEWLSSKDYLSDKMEFIQKEFEQFKKK